MSAPLLLEVMLFFCWSEYPHLDWSKKFVLVVDILVRCCSCWVVGSRTWGKLFPIAYGLALRDSSRWIDYESSTFRCCPRSMWNVVCDRQVPHRYFSALIIFTFFLLFVVVSFLCFSYVFVLHSHDAGPRRLEVLLPDIILYSQSPHASVREGHFQVLGFLPVVFHDHFEDFLPVILPALLRGLADDSGKNNSPLPSFYFLFSFFIHFSFIFLIFFPPVFHPFWYYHDCWV